MIGEDHKGEVAREWARIGAASAAERLGVRCRRDGRNALIQCLWHSDKSPSCSITIGTEGTLRFHCFSCDQTWDVFSAVAQCAGLDAASDFPRVLVRAAELVGRWDVVDAIEGREVKREATPLPQREVVTPEPERDYPDVEEVWDLLGSCARVDEDRGVWDWLLSRGLDPCDVAIRDLALALPPSCQSLPPWARYRGRSWLETGHRVVVPMYDATGALRSVRAGRLADADSPKRLPPTGHRVSGLVMADSMAREVLRAGAWPSWNHHRPRMVIVEGEPDFLTMATDVPVNAGPPRYGVIGICAGSLCEEVASRIPQGCIVAVWTHADPAGDKYAAKATSLLGSRCEVLRRKVAA